MEIKEGDVCGCGLIDGTKAQSYSTAKLLNERPKRKEINICFAWLNKVVRKKSFNTNISSYGLKHLVEEDRNTYVSNGAFIIAAIRSGFKIKQTWIRSPNIYINISNKSIRPI